MDIVSSFAIPALAGIVVGVMSGLLGIGGGTVMVPIFRLAFGMSPLMSTATSLFTIIPTSVSGAVSHVRHRTCVPSLGVAAGLGGALTSPFGVWLAHISPPWAIMLVAALVIGYSAVDMLIKAARMDRVSGKRPPEKGAAVDPLAVETGEPLAGGVKLTRRQLLVGVAIGLGAGVASGYVGVGGGFIMVPLMLSVVGIPMRLASGTSLIAVMILAVPGAVEQGILGNIDYLAGVAVAVGSIPGAIVGARLVRVVPERMLRFLFGGFLVVVAVLLLVNELGILG